MIKWILKKVLSTDDVTLEFILDKQSGLYRKLLILIPLSLWATVFSIITPLFLKWELDALTLNWGDIGGIKIGDTFKVVLIIVSASAILNIANQILNWIKNRLVQKINMDSDAYLEDKFNNFLKRFDSSFLGADNNLRMVRNLQWGLSSLQNNFLNLVQLLVEIPVSIVSLIFVFQYLHPYLLVSIIITAIIVMSLDGLKANSWRKYELIENRASEQKNQLGWRIVWYFNNFLSNGWLDNIYGTYKEKRAKWQVIKLKQNFSTENYGLLITIANEISQFCNNMIAVFLIISGSISIGTLSIFGYYGEKIRDLLRKVGDLFKTIIDMRFNLFRLSFLLHIKPKLDYENISPFVDSIINSIEIKNLTFAYPGFFKEEKEYLNKMKSRLGVLEGDQKPNLITKLIRQHLSNNTQKDLIKELDEVDKMFDKAGENKKILKNLNVKLEKGKLYGIVGYNGAGKTTLTRIIKRTLDAQEGEVLINGRSIKTIDPITIKTYISSMEQNSYLIESLTVRENLLMNTNEKIEDSVIFKIIEAVGLKEVVTDLDAIVGEGLELSGGQSQLLEVARILIAPKPIVILDEGTNQLDAIKEDNIIKLIKENTKNSIVIFITHRMTTCYKCDEVVVIEQGTIEAVGKPEELLESNKDNLFKKFWNVQVSK